MTMPITTPEFLEYARERHAEAERLLRHGSFEEYAAFRGSVMRSQMDADWHAEAVECYERAQRDFEELRRKYNAEVDECERRAAVMIKRAEEIERLRAQRDALRQYITDYGSPADWNRIRRLYPELPPREET